MAAPMQQGNESLFTTAVRRVLDGWTVLQLAVSHGFGGVDSREKADWMVFAVEQWFKENKNIETYEMEDFLADVMNAEFDTMVEDDSLPQIATLICGFYRLYSNGKEEEMRERLQRLPRAAASQSSRINTGGDEESEEEEESNPASASHQSSRLNSQSDGNQQSSQQSQNSQCTPQNQSNESHKTEESMETEQEEEKEGWQVVRKGKRR